MRSDRSSLTAAVTSVAGAVLMASLAGCGVGPAPGAAALPPAATQTGQATPTASVATDAPLTPSPTPRDDLEQKVAAIQASESASAAASKAAAVRRPVATTAPAGPGSTSSGTTAASAPSRTPKPTPSTQPFTGTGHILAHVTDNRPDFQNSYHNGDRCTNGFHYVVDIYNSSKDFVTAGSMQYGVLMNLRKNSSDVEFTCSYPFTFGLSGTSAAYIFNAHEASASTPTDYGTQTLRTAALRAGAGPSFQGADD